MTMKRSPRPRIPLALVAALCFVRPVLVGAQPSTAPARDGGSAISRPAGENLQKEPAPDIQADGFVPLFDGQTLDGWRSVNGTAKYHVEDGSIVGVCDPGSKLNSFLRTQRTYRDFIFTAEVRFDVPGNSGIQFRSNQRDGDGRVYGYQCEIDQGQERRWSGGIYDEARRGWLNDLKGDANARAREAFRHDGWNTFIIQARGRRLQTWVNGIACADYTDNDAQAFTPEGFFALQVHAGRQGTIRWRDIRIKTLEAAEPPSRVGAGPRTAPERPMRDLTFFLRRLRTLDHLPELEDSHTAMSSTWDRSGGNLDGWDFKRVENGRNVLLDVDGPGCIHRIFTGVLGTEKDFFQKPGPGDSHIQIILDHHERPVFDMPVDRLFDDRNGPFPYPLVFHKTYPGILFPIPFAGHCRVQLVNPNAPAWGNEIHFNSLLLGVTPSEAYSCFPMPFADGAVLRFENRSGQRAHKIRLNLDVQAASAADGVPANWGRLHATWNERRAAQPDAPKFGPQNVPAHLVLEREGPGKYVGVLLHLQWPHRDWWGEGDWLIWTDEDGWPPSYHGTGSEEYFNSGWCSFDRKAVSGFIKTRPGEVAVYSFHLNDAFQFRRNIRVAEETMGADGFGMMGNTIIQRDHPIWSSTAYWYARPVQSAGSTPELIQPR
ncbi:MAG: DUF2961 domain-containing protein [Planctomycetes bacterium]|nr:DUF2961 domain-containing protein [Planctomycetota bacterium]